MERKLVVVIVLCALIAGTAAGYWNRPIQANADAVEYVGFSCFVDANTATHACYGMTSNGTVTRLK